MGRFNLRRRDIVVGLATLVGAAVLALFVGAVVFLSGAVNIAATEPHGPLERAFLHGYFKRVVAVRSDTQPPEDFDSEGRRLLGTQHYANACAKCHGGPGFGQNPQALAMRPRPQHLAAVVDQYDDAELFWILKNGVKFSAMPSWPTQARDDEIWSVVAFLRELPDLDPQDYVDRVAPAEGDPPRIPYGDRGELMPAALGAQPPLEDEYLYAAPATEWRDLAMTGNPIARCASCHGADGSGSATEGEAPNLTLQSADYIEQALTDYADGSRKSGIMQIVAANLSADQRRGLAAYYDALPDVAAPPTMAATVPGSVELGRDLATLGKADGVVPACTSCHGRADPTEGGRISVPNLAGQSAVYLRRQLELFRAGHRTTSQIWQPMTHIGAHLSDEEIASVAAYFAGQEPGTESVTADRPVDLANAERLVGEVCKECHTEAGTGSKSGDVPNLTLQTPDYLRTQLWAFKQDERKNSRMGQTAARLSEQEMADLAAYFGSARPVKSGAPVEAGDAASGAAIAENGLPDADVPACLSCHGGDNTDGLPQIARLHGQNAKYLNERLDLFAGEDGAELYPLNPMHQIASRMTDDQRADVAAWFAGQEPLPKD